MNEVTQIMMEGRACFVEKAVYLSATLFGLIPHPEPRIPTVGVTPGMVLYYNPEFIKKLTVEEMAGTYWHECNHVIRRSGDRHEGQGSHEKRNVADDLAINSSSLLEREPNGLLRWKLPGVAIFPKQYGLKDHLTAEEYFELLPDDVNGSGVCGGKCGGQNNELEQELDKKFGRTPAEVDIIQKSTAEQIQEYDRTHPGTVGRSLSEWAKTILKPSQVSWNSLLRTKFRSAVAEIREGDEELSMARPSRRSYVTPTSPIRPGSFGFQIEVAVIIDTSGSMDITQHIVPALRESYHAVTESGADDVWLLQADAEVSSDVRRVRAADLLSLEIKGRGGTDFCVPIAALGKLRPKPAITIYMTDGHGPAPARAPSGMKFIWCLIGSGAVAPARWGQVVRVK